MNDILERTTDRCLFFTIKSCVVCTCTPKSRKKILLCYCNLVNYMYSVAQIVKLHSLNGPLWDALDNKHDARTSAHTSSVPCRIHCGCVLIMAAFFDAHVQLLRYVTVS